MGLLLGLCLTAAGIDITVTGSWTRAITVLDVAGSAGSDLTPSYQSAAGAMVLEISKAGNSNWRVDVRRLDTNWHANLALDIRRTSNGSGSGSVSGGTAYQAVGTTYQSFLTGSKNLRDIQLQLQLRGVSVALPADTYVTTVYFTVVEV